jgi:hypothetical protein
VRRAFELRTDAVEVHEQLLADLLHHVVPARPLAGEPSSYLGLVAAADVVDLIERHPADDPPFSISPPDLPPAA